MKIMVTGGSGMVGKNLIDFLIKRTNYKLYYPSSNELDLLVYEKIDDYLNKYKPDLIIHCAGLVGGIKANIDKPYSFLYQNSIMGFNLIQASVKNKITRLINLGSSCMYPKNTDGLLIEDDLFSGRLEPTNEGYAIAKLSVAKLCEFVKKEFNLDYKTIIPCNIFGKWDNFDPNYSHMIPSAIRKVYTSKINNQDVVIWGDGSARREFMYAEDLVDFINYSISNYDCLDKLTNVGLGYDYSILEYYNEIASLIDFKGKFVFDITKPTGIKRKLCSIKKQNELGWEPKHTLKEGLTKTINFFLKNYEI